MGMAGVVVAPITRGERSEWRGVWRWCWGRCGTRKEKQHEHGHGHGHVAHADADTARLEERHAAAFPWTCGGARVC
jgi:hypothetical protein